MGEDPNRRGALPERLGSVGRGPVQVVAEDDGSSLGGRELLQGASQDRIWCCGLRHFLARLMKPRTNTPSPPRRDREVRHDAMHPRVGSFQLRHPSPSLVRTDERLLGQVLSLLGVPRDEERRACNAHEVLPAEGLELGFSHSSSVSDTSRHRETFRRFRKGPPSATRSAKSGCLASGARTPGPGTQDLQRHRSAAHAQTTFVALGSTSGSSGASGSARLLASSSVSSRPLACWLARGVDSVVRP